jgi:hypothetical protein
VGHERDEERKREREREREKNERRKTGGEGTYVAGNMM